MSPQLFQINIRLNKTRTSKEDFLVHFQSSIIKNKTRDNSNGAPWSFDTIRGQRYSLFFVKETDCY